MDETKIELSRGGISFPYRRYLSDSASGFVLTLLLFLFLYKTQIFQDFLSQAVPSEFRTFIFVLLFLLSTPVGVVLNVISWIFLEPPQKVIETVLITKGFGMFKREYLLLECMEEFGIDRKNWFKKVRFLETELIKKHSIFIDKIESLRGIAILVRNLSLIFGGVAIYLITQSFQIQEILLCFGFGIFLLYISAVVSFYFHVEIIFWAYMAFSVQKKD